MSNYVLVFRSQPDRLASPAEEAAWGAWFARLGDTVVDFGHRVARATTVAGAGRSPEAAVLAGYVVISADDLDAAVELARGCPGLASGASVEVGEAADA